MKKKKLKQQHCGQKFEGKNEMKEEKKKKRKSNADEDEDDDDGMKMATKARKGLCTEATASA